LTRHIYQRRPVSTDAIPSVIFFLLIANGLAFAAQQFPLTEELLGRYLALWPLHSVFADFYPWQLVTS
jgi:membrane associated rhomboid family serine protease